MFLELVKLLLIKTKIELLFNILNKILNSFLQDKFFMENSPKLSEFDYFLPKEQIAIYPPKKRGMTRLLVLNRETKEISHKNYGDFVDFLNEGDVVVLNKTKVIYARIFAKNDFGGKVEIFYQNMRISENPDPKRFRFFALIGGRVGNINWNLLRIKNFEFKILKQIESSLFELEFSGTKDEFFELIAKEGHVPIPKYLKREDSEIDKERYQTIFAKISGSVAAPTASINITDEMLKKLTEKKVKIVYVNLMVGWDTFKPIEHENILDHNMHSEEIEITKETAEIINDAKKANKKILGVGTTVMRVLESASDENGYLHEFFGPTKIFIYPPYNFKIANMMITNFHAPRTTVLIMACAFAGREFLLSAYEIAKKENYKFLSYGDSCLIV